MGRVITQVIAEQEAAGLAAGDSKLDRDVVLRRVQGVARRLVKRHCSAHVGPAVVHLAPPRLLDSVKAVAARLATQHACELSMKCVSEEVEVRVARQVKDMLRQQQQQQQGGGGGGLGGKESSSGRQNVPSSSGAASCSSSSSSSSPKSINSTSSSGGSSGSSSTALVPSSLGRGSGSEGGGRDAGAETAENGLKGDRDKGPAVSDDVSPTAGAGPGAGAAAAAASDDSEATTVSSPPGSSRPGSSLPGSPSGLTLREEVVRICAAGLLEMHTHTHAQAKARGWGTADPKEGTDGTANPKEGTERSVFEVFIQRVVEWVDARRDARVQPETSSVTAVTVALVSSARAFLLRHLEMGEKEEEGEEEEEDGSDPPLAIFGRVWMGCAQASPALGRVLTGVLFADAEGEGAAFATQGQGQGHGRGEGQGQALPLLHRLLLLHGGQGRSFLLSLVEEGVLPSWGLEDSLLQGLAWEEEEEEEEARVHYRNRFGTACAHLVRAYHGRAAAATAALIGYPNGHPNDGYPEEAPGPPPGQRLSSPPSLETVLAAAAALPLHGSRAGTLHRAGAGAEALLRHYHPCAFSRLAHICSALCGEEDKAAMVPST